MFPAGLFRMAGDAVSFLPPGIDDRKRLFPGPNRDPTTRHCHGGCGGVVSNRIFRGNQEWRSGCSGGARIGEIERSARWAQRSVIYINKREGSPRKASGTGSGIEASGKMPLNEEKLVRLSSVKRAAEPSARSREKGAFRWPAKGSWEATAQRAGADTVARHNISIHARADRIFFLAIGMAGSPENIPDRNDVRANRSGMVGIKISEAMAENNNCERCGVTLPSIRLLKNKNQTVRQGARPLGSRPPLPKGCARPRP